MPSKNVQNLFLFVCLKPSLFLPYKSPFWIFGSYKNKIIFLFLSIQQNNKKSKTKININFKICKKKITTKVSVLEILFSRNFWSEINWIVLPKIHLRNFPYDHTFCNKHFRHAVNGGSVSRQNHADACKKMNV